MSFKFNPLEGWLELHKGQNQSTTAVSSEKLITSFEAGETISALKLIYIASSAQAFVADNSLTFSEAQVIGVALNAAAIGAQVQVQLFGLLQDGAFAFSANELLFLGSLGTITATAPSSGFVTRIGYGLGSGSIFLNIEKPIVL